MTTSSKTLSFWAAVLLLSTWPVASRGLVFAEDTSGQTEQSLKNLSLSELGNIEVSSVNKEPQQLWKTPAAIFVITQQDIQRSGATNIPEALRLAPGVEVARISSDEWSIGIRGFGSRLSRSVLVLIDGRIVYSPLTAGVYWEVQDYVMEDIDHIEVIRGPGGTIWGPNAVNGVINIITKSTKDTQGGLVSAGGGNSQVGFGEFRFGGSHGPNMTYRAYGKGFAWAPQWHANGVNYDSWQGGQAGARMDWVHNTRDTFTLQGDAYYQAAGQDVGASNYNPPANYVLDGHAHLAGGNVLWRWRRALGDNKDFQLDAYYDQTTRHELNFGDVRNNFDVDFIDRFPLPRQEISWGAGAYISHGHEINIYGGLFFNPDHITDQYYTAFLQDEITVVKNKLSLILGPRFQQTNYTGPIFEPSVRLLYTPTPTQTLWAGYTGAVRTPADVERNFYLSSYVGPTPSGLPLFARFNANKNFQSERINGYELGYRRLIGKNFYVDIATFFNQYRNLLSEDLAGAIFVENDPAPTHLLLPAEFGNGLIATTEGGEIAPQWHPKPYWRITGSYSFLEMHVKKAPGSQDFGSAPIVQGSSPQHEVLIQNNFDLPKSITADIQVRYVGKLPALSIPSYWTGDLSLGWSPSKQLRFSVVGQNLFQPYHFEYSYDPRGPVGIERSIFARVTWLSK
jgi:iron complex outermembrane recepter protein